MTASPPHSGVSPAIQAEIDQFMQGVVRRNPAESEFHQAVREVATDLIPYVLDHQHYQKARILERMTEPDRVVIFRVTWEDDEGNVRVNRAWRVQFNNAIGPYKGGMRFSPEVNLSVLKFLGFEQVFKNSLTGLPMGGGKGGSNFNPKGKSDREVMRFCQSLMIELHRHIGEDTDVPAGDIGVGSREVGFMFGAYRRLSNRFVGAFTGKGVAFGGSLVRPEATGYGAVYFLDNMLQQHSMSTSGKTALVSGSGNVATFAIEKLMQMGAKVVTASDSSGMVHVKDGFTPELLNALRELKEQRRERIHKLADEHEGVEFHEGQKPWVVPGEVALPCATQNELDEDDAKELVKNGLIAVSEGANMPSTDGAVEQYRAGKVLYGPGKAANAGGVAVSGLEQSQNALRIYWTRQEVEARLREIMQGIHAKCVEYGGQTDAGNVDYVKGANIAGFRKVADAMLACGLV